MYSNKPLKRSFVVIKLKQACTNKCLLCKEKHHVPLIGALHALLEPLTLAHTEKRIHSLRETIMVKLRRL